jgi:hypothetical protein
MARKNTDDELRKETKLMVVLDIETRGRDMCRNGIVSIGVCVGTVPIPGREFIFNVVEKRRFDLAPLLGQTFEPRCEAEFWDKQPALLEKLTAEAVDPMVGIREFRAFLDEWGSTRELVIVSDNPGFDNAFINYYLSLADLPSLLYDKTGMHYRPNFDSDSYARGAASMNYGNMWVDDAAIRAQFHINPGCITAMHTHSPEDDAEYIYQMHCNLVHVVGHMA